LLLEGTGVFFDFIVTAINENNKYIGTDAFRKRFPNSGNAGEIYLKQIIFPKCCFFQKLYIFIS
jgi:hypothetical protein